jgi:hypothetical protein
VFEFGGDVRSEWMAEINRVENVERLFVVHQGGVTLGVAAAIGAAGNRFHCAGTETAAAEFAEQKRGDESFADACVGAGEKKGTVQAASKPQLRITRILVTIVTEFRVIRRRG